MIKHIEKETEIRMKKTIESTKKTMIQIRTSRVSTALLNHFMVDYHGTSMQLNQVAHISVFDARTLSIQPWEKQMLATIEKAIWKSSLGINPVITGETIRICLPPMTESRRIDLVNIVKKEGENCKISIRYIRRDAIQSVRELLKLKEITHDTEKKIKDCLQVLTDKYIAIVDKMILKKEQEVIGI